MAEIYGDRIVELPDFFTPRLYQSEANAVAQTAFAAGETRVLAQLYCGTGKSVIAAMLARDLKDQRCPVLIVTPTATLVEQIDAAFRMLVRDYEPGILSSTLKVKRHDRLVTIGTPRTILNAMDALGSKLTIKVLIVDEADFGQMSGSGEMARLVARLTALNPGLQIFAMTATPWKMKSGPIYEGPKAQFSRLAFSYGKDRAIADGFNAPTRFVPSPFEIDLSEVRIADTGEYHLGDLAAAAHRDVGLQAEAIFDFARHGPRRLRRGLLTAADQVGRDALVTELRILGLDIHALRQEMSGAERRELIFALYYSEIDAIAHVQMASVGVDIPNLDWGAITRGTMSSRWHVQNDDGRFVRTSVGKTDAVILDLVGNARRFGPVGLIDGRAPPRRADLRSPDVGSCGHCPARIVLADPVCPYCKTDRRPPCASCHKPLAMGSDCPLCDACVEAERERARAADAARRHENEIAALQRQVDEQRRLREEAERRSSQPAPPPAAPLRSSPEDDWLPTLGWGARARNGRNGAYLLVTVQIPDGRIATAFLHFAGFPNGVAAAREWWRAAAGTAPPRDAREAERRFAECRRYERVRVRKRDGYLNVVDWLAADRSDR